MPPGELDAFLREPRIAKLATLNRDGSPNIVPVWFEWDGAAALVFTEATSAKVRRIRRDPLAALSVEEPVGLPERWATIEGIASIEPGGFALAERLLPRYYAPDRARDAHARWSKTSDRWVVIRITPRRIRSSG